MRAQRFFQELFFAELNVMLQAFLYSEHRSPAIQCCGGFGIPLHRYFQDDTAFLKMARCFQDSTVFSSFPRVQKEEHVIGCFVAPGSGRLGVEVLWGEPIGSAELGLRLVSDCDETELGTVR